jgi:hypothetical protein
MHLVTCCRHHHLRFGPEAVFEFGRDEERRRGPAAQFRGGEVTWMVNLPSAARARGRGGATAGRVRGLRGDN